jgi:hypothetical protein
MTLHTRCCRHYKSSAWLTHSSSLLPVMLFNLTFARTLLSTRLASLSPLIFNAASQ